MFSFFSRFKIRTQLAVLLLLFGMVPVLAVMPIIMQRLDQMKDARLSQLEVLSETISETIDRNLFERYGDVQAFTVNPAARNSANWRNHNADNPLISSMNNYMQNYGIYKMMMLVDLSGDVLAVNTIAPDGKEINSGKVYEHNFKEEPWFKKAVKKEFLKGKTLTGTVVEQPSVHKIVADTYGDDGFTIAFSAPFYDESGKMLGVWVNFADFGLVEDIVKGYYQQQKERGYASTAIALGGENGVALVNYNPYEHKSEDYKRDISVIGSKELLSLDIPGADKIKTMSHGNGLMHDSGSGIDDAAGFSSSKGAYDYPGLGWAVFVHTPADEAFADIYATKKLLIAIVGLAGVGILVFGVFFGTFASRPLRKSTSNMQAIAKGDYTVAVSGVDRGDEMGEMAKAMQTLKGTLDSNTRLKQALDSVASNVMMADENHNIIYLNEAVMSFLRDAEKDIQKDLPRFSVASLIGSNIDIFHKNPAHQRGMLAKIAEPTKTSIQVGGRSFNLLAVPLFDQNKKRIGTTVEWQDGAAAGMVEAINKSMAVIEFQTDGTILNANENFLTVMGYNLDEVKGKHHSMFADAAYKNSPEYKKFWDDLNRGEAQVGEFKRLAKGGKEIWINASYNPIMDLKGKVVRVVKTAADITKAKMESMNAARLKLALDTCTANVMMADANFNISYLNGSLVGFLQEAEKDIQKDLPGFKIEGLVGRNIDVFHKNPAHQRNMLEKLSDTFRTSIQVGGRSFNLVANPIFGSNKERLGTVVEWQDGTAVGLTDALNRSQAIIEFQVDGTIISANSNFLNAMGYSLDEIKGKHHSMFIDGAYRTSAEYRKFWDDLNRGEAQTGEFRRIGKGNREIWINASYNPIMDLKGKVVRVVKTAADVTQMVTTRTENEQGMNEAVKILTGLSSGDLTQKMMLEYKGTFNEIKGALNVTIDRLRDTVINIKESAQSVNSASSEISAGSIDLSQRTEEQASSLEETAASMEELTGTVRQNSENAKNANLLSSEASEVAQRGGQVVNDAVVAMSSIEKSSQKISDIISVIDEIAFQTNLLALNAAVEAARAGEAGKGFAVVASEVRSLAGRSASASKEIKALIMESSGQVKSGAELVNQAGETLKDIVTSVKKVAEIIAEISNASAEQSAGIGEINTAVSQMDEMTQQNAALVEENTAAAQSLVQQAHGLDQMMQFFKIDQKEATTGGHFEPVVLHSPKEPPAKPVVKPKPVASKAKPAAAKPERKIIAANGSAQPADREWEEF